jgi:hypothetical protein
MNYGFFSGLTPPSFEPFFTELFFVISLSPSLLVCSFERYTAMCMRRAKVMRSTELAHFTQNAAFTDTSDRSSFSPRAHQW